MASRNPTKSSARRLMVAELVKWAKFGRVQLYSAISNSYFEPQTPKRLLGLQQKEEFSYGKWFCADGMYTGPVFLFLQGESSYEALNPSGPRQIEIDFVGWITENMVDMTGADNQRWPVRSIDSR